MCVFIKKGTIYYIKTAVIIFKSAGHKPFIRWNTNEKYN